MKKFLTTTAFVLFSTVAFSAPFLHVATPLTVVTNVKVFHHYTAVDNGDACTTPQELAGLLQGKAEIRNQISGDDAVKLKVAIKKAYPSITDDQLQWDEVDAYLTTAPNTTDPAISIALFAKDASGTLCVIGGGYMTVDDYDKLIKDAGLAPKASSLHLGHVGNPDKLLKHNGKID